MSLYLGENLISGVATPVEPTRNIGQIIESIVPLTDAGSHLLDGALIQGSGIYTDFVDYISNLYNTSAKYSNVTKVGTLTDNNGIISGFSNDNYITYSGSIPTITSFEEVIKIKTASVSTLQTFISGNPYKGFGTVKVTSAGKIQAYISSNGTSTDIINGTTSSLSVQGNTDYWVKLYWDGTTYKIDVSTDGSAYTNYISVTNSNRPFFDGFIGLGKDTGGVDQHFLGSIDLNESYIKINGSLWWVGTIADGFTIEDIWQNSITNYGVCGKFVYDSVNNTVRLPKVTGIIEGTTDVTALGDLVEAGLPNITGGWNDQNGGNGAIPKWGAFSRSTGESWSSAWGSNAGTVSSVLFDASRSSSIYGNSSTVQPQTIKVLYYIVIATSTKTDIEVDIDEIATDLNGKADTDLTNTTDTGKILMSGMAMPSSKIINLTVGASGSTYTAPANGWFSAVVAGDVDTSYVLMDIVGKMAASSMGRRGNANTPLIVLPALKGDTAKLQYSGSSAGLKFIYAQGSESEAS